VVAFGVDEAVVDEVTVVFDVVVDVVATVVFEVVVVVVFDFDESACRRSQSSSTLPTSMSS